MLSNMSLLYVEDDPDIQEAISEILKKECGEFILASNGLEGLQLFKEHRPDIILTDIRMPEMDGLEMSREILKIAPQTPIVISSAFNDNTYLLEAIDIGINEYLIKPFHLDKLFTKLDKIAQGIEIKNHLKETEYLLEQYKQAVDHTTIVSKTDLHGIITYVNEPFIKLSGYTQEELIGQPHTIMRHQDTPSEIFADMWATILNKKIWYGIIHNRAKDGTKNTLKSTITPIINHSGEIVEYLAIREDITELNHAKEVAERSAQLKGEFLANMSHEIRTPMNGILGFTELLSQAKLEHREQKYLDIINSSTHSLMGLINDILDYSKLESGKFELNYHPVDPFDEFEKMSQLFLLRMQEKDIAFNLKIDEQIPQTLEVDSLRVQQVVTNLIGNALKFTPEKGKIDFHVSLLHKSEKYANIRINVKDSGIGISAEQQRVIFKAFKQAQSSTSRKFGGTGLGLSISTNLVHLMGSDLKVKSEENKGSHFYFDLDLKISSQEALKEDQKNLHQNNEHLNFSGKILAADDNPVNRMLLEELLKPYDIELSLATNGKEALALCKETNFDLILMDIKMPVMDGITALEQLKTQNYTAPVVALTANAMEGDKNKFLNQGFDNYLAKPIILSKLLNILKTYLKNIKFSHSEDKLLANNYKENDYVDVALIMSKLSFKKSIVHKLLDMFLKTTTNTMDEIKESIELRDYEHLEASAHFLKGSAGNLRIDSIESLTREIELNSKSQNDVDYKAMYVKLDKVVNNVREEMKEILAKA